MDIAGGAVAANKPRLIAILVITAVLIAAGIWYWRQWRSAPAETPAQTIGAKLYEKAQNPLKDELPEANPFKAETNPFKNTETNPFIGTYENPFD